MSLPEHSKSGRRLGSQHPRAAKARIHTLWVKSSWVLLLYHSVAASDHRSVTFDPLLSMLDAVSSVMG